MHHQETFRIMFKLNPNLYGWNKLTLLAIMLTIVIALAASAPSAQAVPGEQDATLQALMDKAAQNGTVRVLIGLNVPFTPEGELASIQAVQTQQQAIRAAQSRVSQELASYSSTPIRSFKYIPALAAAVDATALAKLAALPDVAYIEEDALSAPTLASSIPIIGADDAWAAGYSGSGQAIAVLDTGVDKTHSFFQGGKVVSEACYSTTYALQGSTTVCPNGNDPTFQDWQIGPGAGIDCVDQVTGTTAKSNCEHGTHVAGIAAGNNGGANIGVAKDANIIAIQVFSYFTGGNCFPFLNCTLTYSSDQIFGLERVYDLRNDFDIAAVNMSLGGSTLYTSPCDSKEASRKAAIDNLRSVGIPAIVATGNDGGNGISAPACISSAISVGSTEDNDAISSFSNVAAIMDLFAPGGYITSSIPDPINTPGTTVGTWNGTSMATPHVAGAWAIVKSFAPDATIDEILSIFKSTGTPINIGGTNISRINIDLAIQALNVPPVANNDGAPTPLNTPVTIDVLINDTDANNHSLYIESVGTPAHGTANIVNNKIEYTPNTGYSGADSFTYTVSDNNGGSDSGTVTVIVDGESVYLPVVMRN